MLHDALANALLAIGVVVGGTTLLDMLLGEATKTFIATATVKTWSYLDDLRRIKFISILRTEAAVFRISMLCVVVNIFILRNPIEDMLLRSTSGGSPSDTLHNPPLFYGMIYVCTLNAAQTIIPVLLRRQSVVVIIITSVSLLLISGIVSLYLISVITSAINLSKRYQLDALWLLLRANGSHNHTNGHRYNFCGSIKYCINCYICWW